MYVLSEGEDYFCYDDSLFVGGFSLCENYLYNVYVLEPLRGRGYGKQIVGYAIKKTFGDVVLDVDVENEVAKRCYEACGFVFERNIKNYYHKCWGTNKRVDVDRYIYKGVDL